VGEQGGDEELGESVQSSFEVLVANIEEIVGILLLNETKRLHSACWVLGFGGGGKGINST